MDGNERYMSCPQLRVFKEVKQNGLGRKRETARKLWFQILDTECGNSVPPKLTLCIFSSWKVPPTNSKKTFPLIRFCNVANIYLCDQQFLLFVLRCYRILGAAPELGQGEQPHCLSTNMLSLHHIPPNSPLF